MHFGEHPLRSLAHVFFLIKLFTFLLLSFAVLCFHEGQHVWKSLSRVLLWPILFTNLCTCHMMAIFSSFNFKLVFTVTREHTFYDACSFHPVRLTRVLGTELQVYFCFHVSPHLNILLCPLLSFLVTENKSDKRSSLFLCRRGIIVLCLLPELFSSSLIFL